MSLTSRLTRIGRLAIAPIKGFFTWKTMTTAPRYEPGNSLLVHLREVARKDAILFYEPFTFAIKAFREERAKAGNLSVLLRSCP